MTSHNHFGLKWFFLSLFCVFAKVAFAQSFDPVQLEQQLAISDPVRAQAIVERLTQHYLDREPAKAIAIARQHPQWQTQNEPITDSLLSLKTDVAYAYFHYGDLQQAMKMASQLSKAAKNNELNQFQAKLTRLQAMLAKYQSKPKRAASLYNKIIENSAGLNEEMRIETLTDLASLNIEKYQLDDALANLFPLFSQFNLSTNRSPFAIQNEIEILIVMANLANLTGEYTLAQQLYQFAQNKNQTYQLPIFEARIQAGLAKSLNLIGSQQPAKDYIEHAINKALLSGILPAQGQIYESAIEIYQYQGNYDLALNNAAKALTIYNTLNYETGQLRVKLAVAGIHAQMGNLVKVNDFLNKHYKTVSKSKNNLTLSNLAYLQSLIIRSTNKKEANRLLEKSEALKARYFKKDSADRLHLQIHQISKAFLEQKLVSQTNKLSDIKLWFWKALVAAIVVASLFTVMLLRLKRANSKLKKQIDTLHSVQDNNEQLNRIARIDTLTGIYNRRFMSEKLTEESARHERSNNPLCIILIDIDHFKKFNDNFGHKCGDIILKKTATTLKETARKQDILARWGGEEFIFLLPETRLEGAKVVAEKLRKQIAEQLITHDGITHGITISAGAAMCDPNHNINDCINHADAALYQAKHEGRNRVAVHRGQ